jgi:hypothetical protein
MRGAALSALASLAVGSLGVIKRRRFGTIRGSGDLLGMTAKTQRSGQGWFDLQRSPLLWE